MKKLRRVVLMFVTLTKTIWLLHGYGIGLMLIGRFCCNGFGLKSPQSTQISNGESVYTE